MKNTPRPSGAPDTVALHQQVRLARTRASLALERFASARRRYSVACAAAAEEDIICPPVPYVSSSGHRLL